MRPATTYSDLIASISPDYVKRLEAVSLEHGHEHPLETIVRMLATYLGGTVRREEEISVRVEIDYIESDQLCAHHDISYAIDGVGDEDETIKEPT